MNEDNANMCTLFLIVLAKMLILTTGRMYVINLPYQWKENMPVLVQAFSSKFNNKRPINKIRKLHKYYPNSI